LILAYKYFKINQNSSEGSKAAGENSCDAMTATADMLTHTEADEIVWIESVPIHSTIES
jgi:hypothetical protein